MSINKSITQKTLVQSNSSILFNNSVVHESTVSYKNSTKDLQFEYPPNPTISQQNHSELLKNSNVMLRLSNKKKYELSNLHQSIKDPNVNIFKLKEGDYDNMTYQAKAQKQNVFIPKDQMSQNKNNYKFQLSKKEYFDSIENLPRASINPFHLVPDLNPTKQDLVTQLVPIYQKLSIKNQNNMLDDSLLTKDFVNEGKKSARQSYIKSDVNDTVKTDSPSRPYQNFTLDQSEFDLFFKQKEQQQKIQMDQQKAINDYAKNHDPNFKNKSELAQLAKCMILNQNNSPFNFKTSQTISLGRSAEDLLKISRFNDRDYFYQVKKEDKIEKILPEIKEKLQTQPNFIKGNLVFGRIAHGLVEQHNPSDKLRYSSKDESNVRKNQQNSKNLSIKRQNLYRNLASYNILSHSMRISHDDYLQQIDKNYERQDVNINRQQPRLYQPVFMTQQQQAK